MPRATRPENGALLVTLDVGDEAATARGRVRQTAKDVLRLAERHDIACTWVVEDATRSEIAAQARAMAPLQEVALLAGGDWAGASTPKHVLGAELRRRVTAARDYGCPVSSLVGRTGELTAAYDVMAREGVIACCGITAVVKAGQPVPMRHGVWHVPASVELDGSGGIGSWRGVRKLRQALDQLPAKRETLHLIVRDGELAKRGTTVLGPLLERAANLRARSGLAIETMGGLARRASTVQRAEPAQSILKRRAA